MREENSHKIITEIRVIHAKCIKITRIRIVWFLPFFFSKIIPEVGSYKRCIIFISENVSPLLLFVTIIFFFKNIYTYKEKRLEKEIINIFFISKTKIHLCVLMYFCPSLSLKKCIQCIYLPEIPPFYFFISKGDDRKYF